MAYKYNGSSVAINDSRKGTFKVLNPGNFNNSNKPNDLTKGAFIYNSNTQRLETLL